MTYHFKKIAFLFFFSFCISCYAEESYRFILPVDWTSERKINLEVQIPQGYYPLQKVSEWDKEKNAFIEFVPSNENGDTWTNIVTINQFIGQKIKAGHFMELLKKQMLSNLDNGTVLSEGKEDGAFYQKAFFVMSYDYEGSHEVIGAVYYSGPIDCVGVQYTVRVKDSSNDQEAAQKIENYFKSMTRVESGYTF